MPLGAIGFIRDVVVLSPLRDLCMLVSAVLSMVRLVFRPVRLISSEFSLLAINWALSGAMTIHRLRVFWHVLQS